MIVSLGGAKPPSPTAQPGVMQALHRQSSRKAEEVEAEGEAEPVGAFVPEDDGTLCGHESLEDMLKEHLPPEKLAEALRVMHGYNQGELVRGLSVPSEAEVAAGEMGIDFKAFEFRAAREQLRAPRKVKVAIVQNRVDVPTDAPFQEQKDALIAKISDIIDVAGKAGVRMLCLQEAWNMPFAFCTREKSWCEFAETIEGGASVLKCRELARKWGMVIVSPILERDEAHADTIWNTAVVIGHSGNIVGFHRKNHIPRVGDFNESTYYMEGNTGHPVFETKYGRIGINICYGRHHVLNWMGFGLNGADIVFNPSATVGKLSEPMWPVEGRTAAIGNSYFVGSINRVGTESFPNAFTSGDGNPSHKDFGHFYGSSYFAAPDASRTPALARNKDGLLIAECDFNLIQQTRDKWGIQMTGRHEIYAELLARYTEIGFQPQIIRDPQI